MSDLLCEPKSIAARRSWKNVGTCLAHAAAALVGVEPLDGEKGGVEFQPVLRRQCTESDEW
jgi:hypothetical protein